MRNREVGGKYGKKMEKGGRKWKEGRKRPWVGGEFEMNEYERKSEKEDT